jgi:hypothetical protein
LRARREWPRRGTAEHRDELASPHAHPSSDLGPHITTPLRKNAAVHPSKNCALCRRWVRLGHSAMVGSMSGLPKSGHDWAIYEVRALAVSSLDSYLGHHLQQSIGSD